MKLFLSKTKLIFRLCLLNIHPLPKNMEWLKEIQGGCKMKRYMELMQNINLELTEEREWEDGNATYCTLVRKYIFSINKQKY